MRRRQTKLESRPRCVLCDAIRCKYSTLPHKLFPEARFVHLVRDVTDVVRSLLNFFPDGRNRLVANEQVAYEYWLRKVTACFEANRHMGPISYIACATQISPSNPRLRCDRYLIFSVSHSPQCLEPLAQRIN